MMIKLFLDDNRFPSDVWRDTIDPDYEDDTSWTIVRSYAAFKHWILTNGLPTLISFDHDLTFEHYLEENQHEIDYSSMEVKTGFHAAEWLITYCKEQNVELPNIKVHSMNKTGKNNILQLIEAHRNTGSP